MNKTEIAVQRKAFVNQLKNEGFIKINDAVSMEALMQCGSPKLYVDHSERRTKILLTSLQEQKLCLHKIIAHFAGGKYTFEVVISDDTNKKMRKYFEVGCGLTNDRFVRLFANFYFQLMLNLSSDIYCNPFNRNSKNKLLKMRAGFAKNWNEV